MTEILLFTNDSSSNEGLKDILTVSSNVTTGSAPVEAGICDMGRQYLVDLLVVKLIFFLLYFIIFCLGFFGNILVITVVIRNSSMHSVTNFFILNLAISDVIMCMVAVPFTPLMSFAEQFFAEYLANDISCKLPPFAMGVSVYISTLTMTIIAIDRYVVILYPFRARMQVKTCAVLVGVINLLSMLFTAPYVHIMDSVEIEAAPDKNITQCQETWEGPPRQIYGIFTNITQFVIPFLTIIVCYAAVIQSLNKRSTERPGAPRSAAREAMERARTKRTNRMLIYMVIVFGICWLPLNSMNFLADLNGNIYCWEYYFFSFFIAHIFAMSSTCYNPFLYGRYNDAFQKEFVSLIPFLKFICVRKEENGGNSTQAITMVAKVTNKSHYQETVRVPEPDVIPTVANHDLANNSHKNCIQNVNGSPNLKLQKASKAVQVEPNDTNSVLDCSSTPLIPQNISNNSNQNSIKDTKTSTEILGNTTSNSIANDKNGNEAHSFV